MPWRHVCSEKVVLLTTSRAEAHAISCFISEAPPTCVCPRVIIQFGGPTTPTGTSSLHILHTRRQIATQTAEAKPRKQGGTRLRRSGARLRPLASTTRPPDSKHSRIRAPRQSKRNVRRRSNGKASAHVHSAHILETSLTRERLLPEASQRQQRPEQRPAAAERTQTKTCGLRATNVSARDTLVAATRPNSNSTPSLTVRLPSLLRSYNALEPARRRHPRCPTATLSPLR